MKQFLKKFKLIYRIKKTIYFFVSLKFDIQTFKNSKIIKFIDCFKNEKETIQFKNMF